MSKAPLLVTILSLGLGLVACEPADPLVEARALFRAGDAEGAQAVLRDLLEERPDVELIVYHAVPEALFALLSGEVDAFVYPQPALLGIAQSDSFEERIKTLSI